MEPVPRPEAGLDRADQLDPHAVRPAAARLVPFREDMTRTSPAGRGIWLLRHVSREGGYDLDLEHSLQAGALDQSAESGLERLEGERTAREPVTSVQRTAVESFGLPLHVTMDTLVSQV